MRRALVFSMVMAIGMSMFSSCSEVLGQHDALSISPSSPTPTPAPAPTNTTATWTASTFAGTGSPSLANGTPGTGAAFNAPIAVCSDGTSLWVLDETNNAIRKIVISTTAVSTPWAAPMSIITGTQPNAICTDGTNLYIANNTDDTIVKIVIATGTASIFAGASGVPGTADNTGTSARFSSPQGICYDAANDLLWVADSGNNTIRKIAVSTALVTTWAGPGAVSSFGSAFTFSDPRGICTDGTHVYVADFYNQTIDEVSISSGTTTVLAGGIANNSSYAQSDNASGPSALVAAPEGICTDKTSLFFTDNGQTIRRVTLSTTAVTTIAGAVGTSSFHDGSGTNALFNGAAQLCFDTNALYVADQANNRIRKVQ